ncbi:MULTISPECIES: regulatory iron-sulfur-containing complex subunit RicT [Anaerolinea]|uniref:PSP1 domain-containing protein n=1 Tax=Anaerolinea TaxID=233189 RepID=UPI00261F4577|nr:regulatory iron-sulfur-containing complex subunit RicT [Anaerolinea thermophila]
MNGMLPVLVGVRFSKVGKIYHFDATLVPDVEVGDSVVVETARGLQIGTVAQIFPTPEEIPEGLKRVERKATPQDLLIRQEWQAKEAEVVSVCKARARELGLSGVKIVAAEYSFDGTKLAILFSTETDERVDLKSLRQDMQKQYAPAQVELRQIGPRDVAKLLGGMGACGLESRCCSQFLCEFSSISIRMAKEQGISLTPSEITGMCGRLRCCLIYEFQQYAEARARLPKRNKRVVTPDGEGKVVDVVPLKGAVIVELPDGVKREYPGEKISLVGEPLPQSATPVTISAEEPEPADLVEEESGGEWEEGEGLVDEEQELETLPQESPEQTQRDQARTRRGGRFRRKPKKKPRQ